MRLSEWVKSQVTVLDVAQQYTTLNRSGMGKCPLHQDDTASFSVNANKGVWHCFGCSAGGDAIRLVELIEGLSFMQALEKMQQDFNIPPPVRQHNRIIRDQILQLEAAGNRSAAFALLDKIQKRSA